MISNTQFVVMLGQNETDREQLATLLHIPKETMDTYLNGVAAGSGMIYAGDYGVIPFDNSFPTDTEIYRIITTKFGEVMQRAEDQPAWIRQIPAQKVYGSASMLQRKADGLSGRHGAQQGLPSGRLKQP